MWCASSPRFRFEAGTAVNSRGAASPAEIICLFDRRNQASAKPRQRIRISCRSGAPHATRAPAAAPRPARKRSRPRSSRSRETQMAITDGMCGAIIGVPRFAADLSHAAHAHIGAGLVFIGATVASHLVGRNVGTIFFLTVTLHPWDGATFATREGTIAQCDESTRAPGSSDIEVTGREASVPRHAQGQFDSRTS